MTNSQFLKIPTLPSILSPPLPLYRGEKERRVALRANPSFKGYLAQNEAKTPLIGPTHRSHKSRTGPQHGEPSHTHTNKLTKMNEQEKGKLAGRILSGSVLEAEVLVVDSGAPAQ